MTDLEICVACARAIGLRYWLRTDSIEIMDTHVSTGQKYWPLTDKAQAMDLVIALKMTIDKPDEDGDWGVTIYTDDKPTCAADKDILRAIATCVARLAGLQSDRNDD